MNLPRFLFFALYFSVCLTINRVHAQIGGFKSQSSLVVDTNRVIFDEQGKPLRYYQYQKLLNGGQYTLRTDGHPQKPNTKFFLVRLTLEEKLQTAKRVRNMMLPNSTVLIENSVLSFKPFFDVIPPTEFDNKIKVLVFWAAECAPCTESFENINSALREIYKPEEIILLAITRDLKMQAERKLIQKPLLGAKLVANADNIFNAYDLQQMPAYIITDKRNVIQYAVTGIGPQVMSTFSAQLSLMLQP